MKYIITSIVLFTAFFTVVQALPPDPELQKRNTNSTRVQNLKPRYTFDEIDKCATDSFVTIAKNWQNLPSIHRRELKPIFLRPGLPGSFFGDITLPLQFNTPHFRIHYTRVEPHAPPLEDFHRRTVFLIMWIYVQMPWNDHTTSKLT